MAFLLKRLSFAQLSERNFGGIGISQGGVLEVTTFDYFFLLFFTFCCSRCRRITASRPLSTCGHFVSSSVSILRISPARTTIFAFFLAYVKKKQ